MRKPINKTVMEFKEYEAEAYDYKTMMKTAYLWSPVFSLVIFICASFEKLRFFLFLTVGAATYGSILNIMKKKSSLITFNKNNIIFKNKEIKITEIEDYYTCLPLNELFMLRMKIENRKEVFYIGKEFREEIENIMNNYHIPFKKTNNDIWLKYSHIKFAFISLIICGIIMKAQYLIKYSI